MQYFANVLVFSVHITWPKQLKLWNEPAVVGSIVVVGALTQSALFYSVYDLKVTLMNDRCSLIQKLVARLKLIEHNTAEATKTGESTVDCSTVIRRFKKFRLGCNNLNNQARSHGPETRDFEAVLHAMAANLVSSTQRVSGELSTSIQCSLLPSWPGQKHPEQLNCASHYQNVIKHLNHLNIIYLWKACTFNFSPT